MGGDTHPIKPSRVSLPEGIMSGVNSADRLAAKIIKEAGDEFGAAEQGRPGRVRGERA
jgi:hypothetical protein